MYIDKNAIKWNSQNEKRIDFKFQSDLFVRNKKKPGCCVRFSFTIRIVFKEKEKKSNPRNQDDT